MSFYAIFVEYNLVIISAKAFSILTSGLRGKKFHRLTVETGHAPWLAIVLTDQFQKYEFKFFWGFQKNEYFLGYEDCGYFVLVITKLDYI